MLGKQNRMRLEGTFALIWSFYVPCQLVRMERAKPGIGTHVCFIAGKCDTD